MQKRKAVWPWAVVGVVAVGGAAWWMFRDDVAQLRQPTLAVSTPADSPASAAIQAPGPTQPAAAAKYPLDVAADPALPALADSDASSWQALSGMFPAEALAVLLREHLIQRVVVHVDNLTQPSLPGSAMALRPLPGTLLVEQGRAGGERLAAANAARYAPFVDAFTRADAGAVAAAYSRFYPLLQQAYRDIGHPNGHFNDRLVAVIDHLLQTPEPARPLALEPDGKGRYRFVEPALQSLSVGQKALLRMDAAQRQAVKQQLRALRAAITKG